MIVKPFRALPSAQEMPKFLHRSAVCPGCPDFLDSHSHPGIGCPAFLAVPCPSFLDIGVVLDFFHHQLTINFPI